MNPWYFLAAAIILEIVGTFLLKLSNGFEKVLWGSLSLLAYTICFFLLAPAMKALPVGLVYAIWAGFGIVAATAIGVMAFDEKLTGFQFLCIGLVLIGSVGLRISQAG